MIKCISDWTNEKINEWTNTWMNELLSRTTSESTFFFIFVQLSIFMFDQWNLSEESVN